MTLSRSGMDPKICVVTGATGGIGKWIALGMAQAGFHVVLVGRDAGRAAAARLWIATKVPDAALEIMLADLSSMAETRALARRLLVAHPRLDVLILNAGVFRARPELTAEGHDVVLAVNYLSPFILMTALQPALRAAAPSRIVTIGSSTSDRARLTAETVTAPWRWNMLGAYARSKLAVMIATFEVARRLEGSQVTANVVHPGAVASGLIRSGGVISLVWWLLSVFFKSERQGADTPIYLSLTPDLRATTGEYFKRRRIVRPNRLAHDARLASEIWQTTEQLLNPSGQSVPVDR